MLARVSAIEFIKPMKTGRTGPLLLGCDPGDPDADVIEAVTKFSAGCDEGVVNLAREVVAASLARDLQLPVPVPLLVEVSPEFAATIADPEIATALATSYAKYFDRHRR